MFVDEHSKLVKPSHIRVPGCKVQYRVKIQEQSCSWTNRTLYQDSPRLRRILALCRASGRQYRKIRFDEENDSDSHILPVQRLGAVGVYPFPVSSAWLPFPTSQRI
jgi:hypothetical protein